MSQPIECLAMFYLLEKTEVFLEVFGNSEIRSHTEEILRHAASQLSVSVNDTLDTATNSCLDTASLKAGKHSLISLSFKDAVVVVSNY